MKQTEDQVFNLSDEIVRALIESIIEQLRKIEPMMSLTLRLTLRTSCHV